MKSPNDTYTHVFADAAAPGHRLAVVMPVVLGAFVVAAAFPATVHAQDIRINEVLAVNDTINPDNTDFSDYADWIELHNTTSRSVSLAGYHLTDDLTLPARWPIPAGASIPANGYLLIWADGFDAAPGETHVRAFSPWDDFRTRRYHANFKLGSGGESLGLFRFEGGTEEAMLVDLGAEWRYLDTGADPGNAWVTAGYDDSAWKSGPAQLGYGENDQATTIGFGPDSDDKYPACHFRHAFEVGDPSGMTELRLRLLADDGAIVYLNGEEIARVRMPDGAVTSGTFASANAAEDVFDEIAVPAGRLRQGENLLAVEVHQVSADSSDVSFDLELSGQRNIGPVTLVDSVTYGVQRPDISYGRDAADPSNWTSFGEPTPGAANTTAPASGPAWAPATQASPAGGFYPAAQQVELATAAPAAVIRYTLDGSRPSSSSPAYGEPLVISQTTVVRARTFEEGKVPGEMLTQTYFINEPARSLPVVSFVVEPDVFFDNTLGIYDNVYKGREAPVSLEYYDGRQNLAFKVNAGAKIGGENIWRFAQKPLNIAMRGKYGDDLISYKIFPDEGEGTFDAIAFRNGGDNWPNAMLRDPMAPSIVRGQMDNDVAAYRPCVLYMNGRYWGIHNVRERHGDRYYFNRYHINAGGYDLLVKEHTINGTELVVNEGSADSYLAFEAEVTGSDLAVAANYDAVAAQMDVDSLIDYACMVDFVYESSWHHNQEFWRERRDGAKWRWTINDIDRGFNDSNVNSSLIDDMLDRHPVFSAMVANAGFRDRFVQRYAAHISSTFHPDRIAEIVDRLAGEVDPEIPRHIARWRAEGGIQSVSSRRAHLNEIKQFAVGRLAEVYSDTARILEISGSMSTLAVDVVPAGAGVVSINGVPMLPQYSNTARLYRNIAFDLAAAPVPGYEFAGWSDGAVEGTVSRTLTGNLTLTATFRPSGESLIPAVIEADTTLAAAGSPHTSPGDVTVNAGVTLTIEAGAVIRMPAGASIYVNGALVVEGTAAEPVLFEPRSDATSWGALAFVNATGTSELRNLVIRGATHAAADPVNLIAAVSGYHSSVVIEGADIDAPLPVFARGGSTTVRASTIHAQFTGDGINIKGGAGLVEDCTFLGNDSPDTDAIDFDGVVDGIIRRNRIYHFRADNSDAIDVGEGCVNLLVEDNRIYHASDKGVSVGQGSEVRIERNLIVGCSLGIGVKDAGSLALVDQNTFALNGVGVAVYEKNLDAGGGAAVVTNSIFTRSKDAPVTVDSLSSLSVGYSLSDTLPLEGTGNLTGDPLFTDAEAYDFSLVAGSPAIDAGDPAHAPDGDGSRADIGAHYVYDPGDYPFFVPNVVVINELLAHSHDEASDWIELHNASNAAVDISGWYLSDSRSDLMKYRIAPGTVLAPDGYLVFYEHETFGAGSPDPNAISPFALSENGETVYLFGPGDGVALDYLEEESFGPSPTGVSKGRHRKSTNTFNFVSMATPTPGAANSAPMVGPVVISEIMYKPQVDGDAEYLELTNISGSPVTLFDAAKNEPWRFTDGIEFAFSVAEPVTLAAGERVVLVRNETAFRAEFTVPQGTRVFQWASGGLSNGGEQLELSSPGDVDAEGVRQWYRIDRVTYGDDGLWPVAADGQGMALARVDESAYGNDVSNWTAAAPTPGAPPEDTHLDGFEQWALQQQLPAEQAGFADDAEGDGYSNGLEFAFGTDPLAPGPIPSPAFTAVAGDMLVIEYPLASRSGLAAVVETSDSLAPDSWAALESTVIPGEADSGILRAEVPLPDTRMFFRARITPAP